MKRVKLIYKDPPIHLVGAATPNPKYVLHLEGTEPASFVGKVMAFDLSLQELIALRDRIDLALEGQDD